MVIQITKSEEIALVRKLFDYPLNDDDKRVLDRFKMVIGKRHLEFMSDEDKRSCISFWEKKERKIAELSKQPEKGVEKV